MPGEASPASHPVAEPAKNTVPPNAARAASRCAIITLASPSRPRSSHTEAQSADRKLHRYFLVNRCRRQLSFDPPHRTRTTRKASCQRCLLLLQRRAALAALKTVRRRGLRVSLETILRNRSQASLSAFRPCVDPQPHWGSPASWEVGLKTVEPGVLGGAAVALARRLHRWCRGDLKPFVKLRYLLILGCRRRRSTRPVCTKLAPSAAVRGPVSPGAPIRPKPARLARIAVSEERRLSRI